MVWMCVPHHEEVACGDGVVRRFTSQIAETTE